MRSKLWSIFIISLTLYYFYDGVIDIFQNLSIYFPFLSIATYLDFIKFVAIPKLITCNETEYLFTHEELQTYSGENEKLYISILGKVFDVSAGASYYGKGQVYHVFTGRDASKAFISGDFTPTGLTDEVLDLSLPDLLHLKQWLKMYETKYKFKGKLIGKFFDAKGQPTNYHKELDLRIKKAEENKNLEDIEKHNFPPCNVEWSAEKGSRVWCTRASGGIERNWSGVPRKLYIPGSKSYRCACVNNALNDDTYQTFAKSLAEYENCDTNSFSCYVKT